MSGGSFEYTSIASGRVTIDVTPASASAGRSLRVRVDERPADLVRERVPRRPVDERPTVQALPEVVDVPAPERVLGDRSIGCSLDGVVRSGRGRLASPCAHGYEQLERAEGHRRAHRAECGSPCARTAAQALDRRANGLKSERRERYERGHDHGSPPRRDADGDRNSQSTREGVQVRVAPKRSPGWASRTQGRPARPSGARPAVPTRKGIVVSRARPLRVPPGRERPSAAPR